MCEIKDAERFVKLARMEEKDGERNKARESYLEAASIFILQCELTKNQTLLEKANQYYRDAGRMINKKIDRNFSKQELARRILDEQQEKKVDVLALLKKEVPDVQ